MPKIREDEYGSLKSFFAAWMEHILPFLPAIPAEHHPVTVLEATEKVSMSKARQGLGMVLNDVVEMSWGISPEEVTAIDLEFSARGLLTLSEIRRRYSRQFRTVLKRGKIRSDAEFYLVSGILASFTADASEAERSQLGSMVVAYEERTKNKKRTT